MLVTRPPFIAHYAHNTQLNERMTHAYLQHTSWPSNLHLCLWCLKLHCGYCRPSQGKEYLHAILFRLYSCIIFSLFRWMTYQQLKVDLLDHQEQVSSTGVQSEKAISANMKHDRYFHLTSNFRLIYSHGKRLYVMQYVFSSVQYNGWSASNLSPQHSLSLYQFLSLWINSWDCSCSFFMFLTPCFVL